MQRRALNCKGFTASVLFLIFGLISVRNYTETQIGRSDIVLLFSMALFIQSIARALVKKDKILLAGTLILLFFSLLIGYIEPSFCSIEMFFVPFILFEITIDNLCKWPKSIPMLIITAVFSAFVFPGFRTSFEIKTESGTVAVPVIAFTLVLFISCAIVLIFISYLKNKNAMIETELKKAENHNDNLMKINSEISSKLFRIQQDSSAEERMRITKEVHDTAGYVFINVIMMLQAALAIIDKDYRKGVDKVGSALEYARSGMNEIRMTLREMRAYEKPNIGIRNELHNIVAVFRKATDIEVSFEYGNWPNHFNKKETELFIASLVQECLTNTVKHGNADAIDIFCWKDNESYSILIQDNGAVRQKDLVLGIGLSGIEDFVNTHGGKVSYGYNQEGFIVSVKLPLSC